MALGNVSFSLFPMIWKGKNNVDMENTTLNEIYVQSIDEQNMDTDPGLSRKNELRLTKHCQFLKNIILYYIGNTTK